MSSLLLLPLSVAAVISGATGALGAPVSMLIGKAGLCADSFPATSVTVLVMLWVPAVNGVVGVKVLVPALKVAGTFTPSTYKLGVSPAAGAGTVKLGVTLLVLLSVLLLPVSVAAVMSGAAGALGAAVSMVIGNALLCADSLPATSVTV